MAACFLLYSLFKHECVATHSSNTVIKFADKTAVIGLITGDNEMTDRKEVNLHLNVSKQRS